MSAPETVVGDNELVALPALELAAMVRHRKVSSTELVEASLARIAQVDHWLNAFVTVDGEGARRQATAADKATAAGRLSGPLHGIPMAIKDLTPTRGLRTTYGSRAFANHVPDLDANSVARIRAAGMVIVGKTSTCEFGALPVTESRLTGPCLNPWDASCNSGGSSGGSACAIVAGMVPIAHGTDGGGSIRIPAALCGSVGLKPSRGRISLAPRGGERLMGWATEGALARTVSDAAALLDVMSGFELGDPYGQPPPARSFLDELASGSGRSRIGVALESPSGARVDPQLVAVVTAAASQLESLGHEVQAAAPAWDDSARDDMSLIWSTVTAYYDVEDIDSLEERTRATRLRGERTTALEYVQATVRLQRLAREVASFWGTHDVLLCPVTPMVSIANVGDPADIDAELMRDLNSFTCWANLTGQPAIALPAGRGKEGLPLSIQLVGPPGDEVRLLRLAAELEATSLAM